MNPWIMVGAFLTVLLLLGDIAADQGSITQEEAFAALRQEPFEEPLPPGMRVTRSTARPGGGERNAYVTYSDVRETETVSGAVILITYEIATTHREAQAAFDESFTAGRSAEATFKDSSGAARSRLRALGGPVKLFSLPLRFDHFCVTVGRQSSYCQFALGPVYAEVTSHAELFGERSSRLEALTLAAHNHLKITLAHA